MKFILNFLLAYLLLANSTHAIHNESPIINFAQNFPNLTHVNTERQTTVASNGQSSFRASGMIFPENEADLVEIIKYFSVLKEKDQTIRPLVISAGSRSVGDNIKSGWSFDCHAQGHDGDIVLNTSKLRGLYEDIDWSHNFDQQKGVVKVWAYAGTGWRDLVNLVNESYVRHTSDQDNYFVPIISPTGSKITIGGSFASNTHARGTSVKGGYFADTIDAFNLVTLVNGQPTLMTVEKEHDPDLFYALVGSFGRGGIVSAIKINLQMVSQDQVATTRVKKVYSIDEMTQAFAADRERLAASDSKSTRTDRNAFLASVGIISDDFKTFFMLENDLETPANKMPSFPLYGAPDCKALFIHKAARAFPKLADCLAGKYLDWHCAKTPCEFFSGNVSGIGEFHDMPLNNYIFFQDTFALSILKNKPKDHQTSHFTLMMRLENLGAAMEEIKRIKALPEFKKIVFELQDLLPLPSTKVLMAPGYSPNSNDDIFIAYTISWPVDDDSRDLSRILQAMIETALYEIKVDGQPLAWLHPLKEFSFKKGPIEFYAQSAQKLEKILEAYGIEDRTLFYSKIHDYLYARVN